MLPTSLAHDFHPEEPSVGIIHPIGFGLTLAPDPEPLGLDLGQVRLVVEEGLLMVIGPDGDPLPPDVFAEAAASRPGVEVMLDDGTPVVAGRASAVLDAQMGHGALTPPVAGCAARRAWILAMLGVGPSPEPTPDALLRAEATGRCAVTAIGSVLSIRPELGDAFLVAAAGGTGDAAIAHLTLDDHPITPATLTAQLRHHVAAAAGAPPPTVSELTLDDIGLTLENAGIELATPFGTLRLASADHGQDPGHAGEGSAVSAFLATGQPVGIEALQTALRDATTADRRQETATAPSNPEGSGSAPGDTGDPAVDATTVVAPGATSTVRLVIEPPCPSEAPVEAINTVLLAGLPEHARLSGGIDQGGGRWLLSPADLTDLTVTRPITGPATAAVRITAIAVIDDAGELTGVSTSATLCLEPQPVPLDLDDKIDDARQVDAVVIRGLGTGMALSAGAHDSAIDGWIVRPTEIDGLEVWPPAGVASPCTLTVMGISLRPVGRPRTRVLGSIPLTFE